MIDLVIRKVNSNNFNGTIFKFSEKFNHTFLDVFIFGNLRVTVSLRCRLQAVSKIHVPNYPFLISETVSQETKYKTCEKLWSHFSEKLRIVALRVGGIRVMPRLRIRVMLLYTCWGYVVVLTSLDCPPVLSPLIEKSMIKWKPIR